MSGDETDYVTAASALPLDEGRAQGRVARSVFAGSSSPR